MDVKGLNFLSSVVATAVWMNERICEYFNSFYFQDVWFEKDLDCIFSPKSRFCNSKYEMTSISISFDQLDRYDDLLDQVLIARLGLMKGMTTLSSCRYDIRQMTINDISVREDESKISEDLFMFFHTNTSDDSVDSLVLSIRLADSVALS